MFKGMSKRSDAFVEEWVRANVHNVPGVEDARPHVTALTAQLVADALAAGISEDELLDTVGDFDDFLTNEFEQVQDPELGFKD